MKVEEDYLDELIRYKAPDYVVEAQLAKIRGVDMLIEPENWQAVMFFMCCSTQWHVGFSGRTGLNYPGVEAAARMAEVVITAQLFDDLQTMEFAYLAEVAEIAQQKR